MKVLFVHNKYLQSAGGEDASVEAEMKLLSDKGHTVEVLFFNNNNFEGSLLSKINAGLRSIYNPQAKQLLKQVIHSFQPAIIHVHNFYFQASPAVFDAAKECKVPVVFTAHNFRLLCVNALFLRNNKVCEACINSTLAWKGIIHKCYHDSMKDSAVVALISAVHKVRKTWTTKINRFITPSSFLRNKLLNSSLQIKDPNKVIVKRNFIPDPGIGPIGNRGSHYLFVGRLSEEKGVQFMLEVFSKLPEEKLLLVGDGPQKEELINAYSQYPNISFLGKKNRQEVLHLLKHCRALVFPSIWYEGLPVTIIEAFATGTPVLSSKLGGMEEMIAPGANGLLFEKENANGLMAAVHQMNRLGISQNDALHKGARNTYLEQYTPEACYKAIMDIYNTVITESTGNTAPK